MDTMLTGNSPRMDLKRLSRSALDFVPTNLTQVRTLLSDINNAERLELASQKEGIAFYRESLKRAMHYREFAQSDSREQRWYAGRAAFLTTAYDYFRGNAVRDRERAVRLFDVYTLEEVKGGGKYRGEPKSAASWEDAKQFNDLFRRDVEGELDDLGFERAQGQFEFVLANMGIKEQLATKCDVGEIGRLFKIADDVSRHGNGQINEESCLKGPRLRNRLLFFTRRMNPGRIRVLFPNSKNLPRTIEAVRDKAHVLLLNGGYKTGQQE